MTDLVVAIAIAVRIAAAVDVRDFGTQEAWFSVTLLTIGYMSSRGRVKSGSRDVYEVQNDGNARGRTPGGTPITVGGRGFSRPAVIVSGVRPVGRGIELVGPGTRCHDCF